MGTSGGYHEYIGGYHEYIGGSSIEHGGTSAFFTTFRTYSNVDPLECIFMALLAIFTLWRYPQ